MSGRLRTAAWVGLGALIGILFFAFRPVAHALPEYATRTGEPCATCHVNPAGGGPRTARGSLWIAAGKPDKVPELPGGGTAAGGAGGAAFYASLGCAGCHGAAGEGGAGPALNKGELPAAQVKQVVTQGKGAMPAIKAGAAADADLQALVDYVRAIGRGEVKAAAQPAAAALPPVRFSCALNGDRSPADPSAGGCGGN